MDRYFSVKTTKELAELGSVDFLIKEIEEMISPLKISGSSHEEIFEAITLLQNNWLPFRKDYFTSKRNEYIYYLLEHEGEKREKLLGIEDEFYSDPKKAKRWYKRIAKIIRADLGDDERATRAFQNLQDIFQDLTDDEAFGDSNE